MIMPERTSKRRSGVGCAGWNPDPLEPGLRQHARVGHAVERHAPAQTQPFEFRAAAQLARHVQHNVFGNDLQRSRNVSMPIFQLLARLAWWPERIEKPLLERPQLSKGVIAEVVEVHLVTTLGQRMNDVSKLLDVGVRAVGGEGHHLTLVRKTEAEVLRHERVDDAERIEDSGMPESFQPVAAADVGARGGVVAETVHDEHRRLLEWTDEEDCCVSV